MRTEIVYPVDYAPPFESGLAVYGQFTLLREWKLFRYGALKRTDRFPPLALVRYSGRANRQNLCVGLLAGRSRSVPVCAALVEEEPPTP